MTGTGLAPHLRRLAKDVAYNSAHAQVMLAAADDLELLKRDNEILREANIRPQDLERRRAERAEARVAELEAEVNGLKKEILTRDSAELSARYAERNARPHIGEQVLAAHEARRKERQALVVIRELAEADKRCPACTGYENILEVLNSLA